MGTKPYDVVVVGAGIAGIAAALSARELGARVLLLTDGTLCGGSSFSSNTWGLGMVSESTEPLIRGHQSIFKALKTMGMGCVPPLCLRGSWQMPMRRSIGGCAKAQVS